MLFLQNRQAMKSVFSILLIVAALTITTGCRTNSQFCGDEFDVTTTIDRAETCRKTSCSLREAIIKANTCTEDQTIQLREGVYTLSIPRVSGNSEVEENTGDLDIKNTVTILGAGKDQTIIDGNNIDRIFDIYLLNGTFINGVTIQNGNSAEAGAIRVNESASLVLTKSKLLNNRSIRSFAGRGEAIYSSGIITLSEVEVRGNSATAYGGGVYSLNGKLKILDSQFIENRAWTGGDLYSLNEIDNSDPTPRDDVLIRNYDYYYFIRLDNFFFKSHHSDRDCWNPGPRDGFKLAFHGTGCPLPGGHDGVMG